MSSSSERRVSEGLQARGDALEAEVAERELDALIVGDLVHPADSSREAMADVSWVSGFVGSSGLILVGAGRRVFITDFRYLEKAAAVEAAGFELIRAERQLIDALGPELEGRVGFDPTATSVKGLGRLEDAAGEGVELVEAEGVIESLRRVKDPDEIAAIAAASKLTDAVYSELEEAGLAGRTELEVAAWIERRMRELGATGPSFPPIVASGPNGALPHAVPGGREIGAGELVVVDLGAILDGYCSDGTRTYASGPVGTDEREVHELVGRALEAGCDAVAAGRGGREVDAVARELIAEAGYGESFGHGLGHGVGIAVHEPPRLSTRSEDELRAGDVVTVEPGIYLPGRFGVRTEDLLVVTEGGPRNLSTRPRELAEIG